MAMREVNYSRAPTDTRFDSSPTLGGTESTPSLAKYAAVGAHGHEGSSARLYSGPPAREAGPSSAAASPGRRRKWWIIAGVLLVLIAIAVAVPVAITKSRADDGTARSGALSPADNLASSSAARSSSAAAATTSAAAPERPTWGTNGDIIESLGLRYNNTHMGTCASASDKRRDY